jgi:hypothetical protein
MPIGIPGSTGAVPMAKTEPYTVRERIFTEVLVFARVENRKLKSFEVHSVVIKSAERATSGNHQPTDAPGSEPA